jgi:predicted RNase H-like nuclease (RuvC/YqgF family)
MSVTRGNPLLVVIETLVTEDVQKEPFSIASTNTAFTLVMEQSLKDMVRQNKEMDDRIRDLEEQIRHRKKDKGSLIEFNACIDKFREELNEASTYMYAHLQVFQHLEAQIIPQHSSVEAKNVQFVSI